MLHYHTYQCVDDICILVSRRRQTNYGCLSNSAVTFSITQMDPGEKMRVTQKLRCSTSAANIEESKTNCLLIFCVSQFDYLALCTTGQWIYFQTGATPWYRNSVKCEKSQVSHLESKAISSE